MQTLIHVFCKQGTSLREQISKDDRGLSRYDLYVERSKKPERSRGWAKIKSLGQRRSGAINVEWDADASVMVCRVVTRGGDPALIVGDFLGFLLASYGKRIRSIHIIPEAGR